MNRIPTLALIAVALCALLTTSAVGQDCDCGACIGSPTGSPCLAFGNCRANGVCGPNLFSTSCECEPGEVVIFDPPDINIADFPGPALDLDIPGLPCGCCPAIMCPVCLCPDWDIQLGIDHTRIGDLTVVLTHLATNTSVVLMDRPGFPVLPQGCAEDLSSQRPILLTDQAVIPIECGSGCQQCFPNGLVQSASYLPNQPLATFAGNPRPGPWRLSIRDNAQGGTGRFAFMSFMVEAQGNNAVIAEAPTAEFKLRLTPNPTSDTVRFELTLSEASSTRLQVFDVAGRVVSTVYDGQLPSGHHSLIWAGESAAGGLVPAGAYFYRLIAGDRRESGGFNVIR